jgi:hypothetical protein
MKTLEWAFIDLENIGLLRDVSIEKYDVIYLFVGATQEHISLFPPASEEFVEIKILKISDSSKDNLDFHLSYYLGKMDALAKEDIGFTVISNDSGFDNLIKHVATLGRKCKRLKVETTEKLVLKKVLLSLEEKDDNKLPKSEKALKNYIKSHLGKGHSERNLESVYNALMKQKEIASRIKLVQME